MYRHKDHYWKKAKREGYRSRAAYKLLEIQRRHRIFHKDDRVLDLGSAPGGWLQVIASEVGPGGRVFGVDRQEVKPLADNCVSLFKGDVCDDAFRTALLKSLREKVRVVTSDMAPDTSGIAFRDHIRSCELVRIALVFSYDILTPGGTLLAKLFQGEDARSLMEELGHVFAGVRWVIPSSSRKESSEIYLLATGFRPGAS